MQGRDLPREHDHPDARPASATARGRARSRPRPPASPSAAAPRRASRPARPTPTARRRACAATARAVSSSTARSAATAPSARAESASRGPAARRRARARACHARCPAAPAPASRSRRAASIRPASAAIKARPAAPPTVPATARAVATCTRRARSARRPACPAGTSTATLARTCDGAGTCGPATSQSCAPYTCNGTSCRAACGMDSDCVSGMVCNAGSCGQEAARPDLRGAGGMRQRQLRRRRLLLVGQLRHLHVVQRGRLGRRVQAGPGGRDGAARRLHPRPALRIQRHLRRRRRLPPDGGGHQLRHGVVQRIDVDAGGRLRRRGELHAEPGQLRALPVRDRRVQDDLRDDRRTASPATPARATRART